MKDKLIVTVQTYNLSNVFFSILSMSIFNIKIQVMCFKPNKVVEFGNLGWTKLKVGYLTVQNLNEITLVFKHDYADQTGTIISFTNFYKLSTV